MSFAPKTPGYHSNISSSFQEYLPIAISGKLISAFLSILKKSACADTSQRYRPRKYSDASRKKSGMKSFAQQSKMARYSKPRPMLHTQERNVMDTLLFPEPFDIRKYLDDGNPKSRSCPYSLESEHPSFRNMTQINRRHIRLKEIPLDKNGCVVPSETIMFRSSLYENFALLGARLAQKLYENQSFIPQEWDGLIDGKGYSIPILFEGTIFRHATEGLLCIALWRLLEQQRWIMHPWKLGGSRVRLGCERPYLIPTAILPL